MTRLTLGPDSVADVEECIYTFVRLGEHIHDDARRWTMDDMRRRIPNYGALVEDVRNGSPVTFFENVATTTWQVSGSPGGVSVRNQDTGESHRLTGPGVIDLGTCASRMRTAVEAWHRTINRCNPADLLTAVGDGFAAIEGYLNRQAKAWTARNPAAPLEDTKENPVNTRIKLKKWVPIMTGGKCIDPTSPFWRDLLAMQRFRNQEAIHPRTSGMAVDLVVLARQLNMFTTGIAIPLLQLHTFFNEQVPAVIIRAAYAPEVRVADPAPNSTLQPTSTRVT